MLYIKECSNVYQNTASKKWEGDRPVRAGLKFSDQYWSYTKIFTTCTQIETRPHPFKFPVSGCFGNPIRVLSLNISWSDSSVAVYATFFTIRVFVGSLSRKNQPHNQITS